MKPRYFTIPNLLTMGNLLCGCFALYFVFALDDLRTAFWLTAVAGVLDFLDGFTARMLKSFSPIGGQLDSLADMVSFGVVPSAVLLCLYESAGGLQPWGYVVFVVALFSALRLAWFNIDDRQHDEFIGMPTPANAFLITSAGYVFAAGFPAAPVWIVIAAVVLASLLIIPVRMFSLKFKNFSLRDNSLRYVFLGLSVVALCIFGITVLPLVILLYIVVSLVRHIIFTPR